MNTPYTVAISTNNNLNYLKLAITSFKSHAFHKDAPIVVYAENCTDGTNEWLEEFAESLGIEYVIESNEGESIRGIGGGMNFCASMVKTEMILFLHSDMYLTPNFDVSLVGLITDNSSDRVVAGSFRIEPDIFRQLSNDEPRMVRPGVIVVPTDIFGEYHNNFDATYFDEYAQEFSSTNNALFSRVEGAGGYLIRKSDWDFIGGNDDLFKPTWGEDMDLFLRMLAEDFKFVTTTESMIYHFAARGSHWKEDDFTKQSQRQIDSERIGMGKWISKWQEPMQYDQNHFIKLTPSMKQRYKTLYNK